MFLPTNLSKLKEIHNLFSLFLIIMAIKFEQLFAHTVKHFTINSLNLMTTIVK